MNTFDEIKELSEEISNAAKRYQEYKEEYTKIMEEAEAKAAWPKKQMENFESIITRYQAEITALKEAWTKYSRFSNSSGIANILTTLIRKIEGDSSLEITFNEDIQFYDAELNWIYKTKYSYIKDFIDTIINKSIDENKSAIDEAFLTKMLEDFLNNHQDLIKLASPTASSETSQPLPDCLPEKASSVWEEIEKLNKEIEHQNASPAPQALKSKKQCLSQIKALKKQWTTYSYFSKASNIVEVLTRLIRIIEKDNSLSFNPNEDIRFYDANLNWTYYNTYPYIKEFIDEVIKARITAQSFYMSESTLNTLLESFLKSHPDLINLHSTQLTQKDMPTSTSFNLFDQLIDIFAEQQVLEDEINNTPRQKRHGQSYQEKTQALNSITAKIKDYSYIPLNTLIFLLELMEGEEFTYKTFKRSKEAPASKQINVKTSNRLGAICKVIHFTSKEHMQTKYIPVIEDGTSITDLNIIEKYPYLSEFSRLFINAQYTVANLDLNYTTEQILNMTIKYFIQIHQEQINARFASNPNEGFDRK